MLLELVIVSRLYTLSMDPELIVMTPEARRAALAWMTWDERIVKGYVESPPIDEVELTPEHERRRITSMRKRLGMPLLP